jgi:hypothetical protein
MCYMGRRYGVAPLDLGSCLESEASKQTGETTDHVYTALHRGRMSCGKLRAVPFGAFGDFFDWRSGVVVLAILSMFS